MIYAFYAFYTLKTCEITRTLKSGIQCSLRMFLIQTLEHLMIIQCETWDNLKLFNEKFFKF